MDKPNKPRTFGTIHKSYSWVPSQLHLGYTFASCLGRILAMPLAICNKVAYNVCPK